MDLKLYRIYAEGKASGNIYDVVVLAESPDDVEAVIRAESAGLYEPFGEVIPVTVVRPRCRGVAEAGRLMVITNHRCERIDVGPRQVVSFLEAKGSPVPEGFTWANSRDYLFPRTRKDAAPRASYPKSCEVFGSVFQTSNVTTARFCGPTCRKRANRAKRREV